MKTITVLSFFLLLFVSAFAQEEPKVYTEKDLKKYGAVERQPLDDKKKQDYLYAATTWLKAMANDPYSIVVRDYSVRQDSNGEIVVNMGYHGRNGFGNIVYQTIFIIMDEQGVFLRSIP